MVNQLTIVDIMCICHGMCTLLKLLNGMYRIFSVLFHDDSDVSQSNTPSPALFSLLVHVFIANLKHTDVDCYIQTISTVFCIHVDANIVHSPRRYNLQARLYDAVPLSTAVHFHLSLTVLSCIYSLIRCHWVHSIN